MSTKCTVLYGKNYHFYWEQMDSKYILESENNGFNDFLQKAGKLLSENPKSDFGIRLINLKTGESKLIKHYTEYANKKIKKPTVVKFGRKPSK